MLNPHHQSRYENTYISPGKYQHKGNKTDVFDRGCSCGHGVNHFRNYRYDSNGIYTPFGYSGNQCSGWIRYSGDCNYFKEWAE